jgi:hypothetical protein
VTVSLPRRWWLAPAGVVLFAVIAFNVAQAAGVILLPAHTPGTKAVPLTVVWRYPGPNAGLRVEILAATSIDDLRSLALAAGGLNEDTCQSSQACWSSITLARPSLLIALSTPAPCRKSVLSADLGPGAHLTIHIVVGGWECPGGAGTLTAPIYWLLAVPLDGLPSTVLTVAVDSKLSVLIIGPGGGEPLYSVSSSTTVDLRPPLPKPADGVPSAAELRSAVQQAQLDADSRAGHSPRLIDLALRRWPRADLGCGSATSDNDLAWGSLIVLRADTPTNAPAHEYHELGGRTVSCRDRTP